MRLAVVLAVLTLLAAAPAASAQLDQSDPLQQAATTTPTPTPEPVSSSSDDGDVGRPLLFGIGAVLLLSFAGLGVWIARDARSSLPADQRDVPERPERDPVAERRVRAAQQRARRQRRAARTARKRNR